MSRPDEDTEAFARLFGEPLFDVGEQRLQPREGGPDLADISFEVVEPWVANRR